MNKSYWMFNCREIATLISQSMDQDLTLCQRMGISFHLMMCSMCSTNKRQLNQLRHILRHHGFPETPLPQEARIRLKKLITEYNQDE